MAEVEPWEAEVEPWEAEVEPWEAEVESWEAEVESWEAEVLEHAEMSGPKVEGKTAPTPKIHELEELEATQAAKVL